MSASTWLELFGYLASVLVAVSLMMSAIIKLRIINLFGSTFFSIYGFMIGALPVGFLNGFIALINIYYLFQIFSEKEYFKTLKLNSGSEYVSYFLNFYKDDILKFIPSFRFDNLESLNVLAVLRNTNPAGIIIYKQIDDHTIEIELDYVIPGYRDFKIAKFAFAELRKLGITIIYSQPGNEVHQNYLKRMGFVEKEMNNKPVFYLEMN